MASDCALAFAFLSIALFAEEPNPTVRQEEQNEHQVQMRNGIAYYKVQVVDRTLPAINYFHRSGSTKVGFAGTSLLPDAKGEAKVDSRNGRTSIDATIENLSPANGFGTVRPQVVLVKSEEHVRHRVRNYLVKENVQ